MSKMKYCTHHNVCAIRVYNFPTIARKRTNSLNLINRVRSLPTGVVKWGSDYLPYAAGTIKTLRHMHHIPTPPATPNEKSSVAVYLTQQQYYTDADLKKFLRNSDGNNIMLCKLQTTTNWINICIRIY